MDLFSVDASHQHEERAAARHASVLSHQRVTSQFDAFLKGAANDEDLAMRYYLIEGDLRRTIEAACEECGHGDADGILSAVEQHIAGGAFCDDCRKWKNGPKALCSCGEDDGESEGEETEAKTAAGSPDGKMFSCPGCGGTVQYQIGNSNVFRGLASGNKCNNCGEPTRNFIREDQEGFGKKFGPFDKLPKKGSLEWRVATDGITDLGGPIPKMDKGNAGDERGNKKQDPINTDGGPYKTVRQDIHEPADLTNQDFLEQTEAVTDHDVDVTKGTETGGVTKGETGSWTGTKGMASPVTSHFLSDDDIDGLI